MERELRGSQAESSITADLLRRYHETGDDAARKRLVELYMPLVDSLVRRHTYTGEDYDDLFQVGCIGLINAIDRFDEARGTELAAFAVPNIAGEIQRYLRDRSATIRLPRRVLDLRAPARHAQTELAAQLGHTPTTAEIAARIGADERDTSLALDADHAASAAGLEPEAEVGTGGDLADDRLFLAEAFRELDERERRIVYLRYVRDLPPTEVARSLGLSERQLSRSAQTALTKLRANLEGEPRLPPTTSKPKMAPMAGTGSTARKPSEASYHIELVRSEESGWDARVEELPGCDGHGATPDEAVRSAEGAMERWMADAAAARREIPKPRSAPSHSGRLMVRMPPSLHGELAHAAQREEVSLNQFITGALASAVRWRSPNESDQAPSARPPMTRLLVLNLVVLAVIAVIALILLVVALT